MASKFRLVSRFPEVKAAAREVTQFAIGAAVLDGENTANDRLASNNMARGYDMPLDVKKTIAPLAGKIEYNHFFGHFFEYGTVRISAMPFIRPGGRKMRKTFMLVMGKDFEPWVKRRASVR